MTIFFNLSQLYLNGHYLSIDNWSKVINLWNSRKREGEKEKKRDVEEGGVVVGP